MHEVRVYIYKRTPKVHVYVYKRTLKVHVYIYKRTLKVHVYIYKTYPILRHQVAPSMYKSQTGKKTKLQNIVTKSEYVAVVLSVS